MPVDKYYSKLLLDKLRESLNFRILKKLNLYLTQIFARFSAIKTN